MNRVFVSDKPDVVVLDDDPAILMRLVELLDDRYRVHAFHDAAAFRDYLSLDHPVDLALVDAEMPGDDGFALCEWMRRDRSLEHIPVVLLTALGDPVAEARGLALGANDWIAKPFTPAVVLARVSQHVRLGRSLRVIAERYENLDQEVRWRTADLEQAVAELRRRADEIQRVQDATIMAFTAVSEARDNETGEHIRRTQAYVRELAGALGEHPAFAGRLDAESIRLLWKSAPLHDLGKVAIPDAVLLKPGRFTTTEFEVMKTHTTRGRDAIAAAERSLGGDSSFLRTAREMAGSHHERWDGSGYPEGLAGEDIPLGARIMAIADVYDALVSSRPYKSPMSPDAAVAIIARGRGTQFDPVIGDVFLALSDRFEAIARANPDATAQLP